MLIMDERPETNRCSWTRGVAYVYFIYGTSYMLNVTAEEAGVGAGVLLRAMEPMDEISRMKRLRKTYKLRDLARGPGRLASALEIDGAWTEWICVPKGPLWLGAAIRETVHISTTVRIGITREMDRLLGFCEVGSPFVSGAQSDKRSCGEPSLQS
jgi:DNA-3-methyladenine glycosylase